MASELERHLAGVVERDATVATLLAEFRSSDPHTDAEKIEDNWLHVRLQRARLASQADVEGLVEMLRMCLTLARNQDVLLGAYRLQRLHGTEGVVCRISKARVGLDRLARAAMEETSSHKAEEAKGG